MTTVSSSPLPLEREPLRRKRKLVVSPPGDTTPPETSIASGPSGTVATTSARFTFQFGADERVARLVVRATDAAGNVDGCLAPGGNLSNAHSQAPAGGAIELSTGNGGVWDTPAGTKFITVRAAAGAPPVCGRLHVRSDNMTLDGIDVDAGGARRAVAEARALLSRLAATGPHLQERPDRQCRGREVRPPRRPDRLHAAEGHPLDNVEFHDVRQVTTRVHNECIFSQVPGLTIRNSTFTNCGTMDLFIVRGDWWGEQPFGDVTVENNAFGHSHLLACSLAIHAGSAQYAPSQDQDGGARNGARRTHVPTSSSPAAAPRRADAGPSPAPASGARRPRSR